MRTYLHLSIWNKISENIARFINNHPCRVFHGRKHEKNQLYLSLPYRSGFYTKKLLQRKLPSSLYSASR